MKKIIYLLLLFVAYHQGFAQIGVYNGKPRYAIQAVRAGTSLGVIEVEMYPTIAPLHVRNFDSLVSISFYDTTAFHRVVPGFVIQGGDPNSRHGNRTTWGYGQPDQKKVPAEFNPIAHVRGVFSAARSTDINSATSQFFICVATASNLDWNYTAYGKVYSRIEIVDNIVSSPRDTRDNPLDKIEMFITRLADDTTKLSTTASIIQPADNAIGITSTYQFKWDALPGALIYELEISKSPAFDVIDTVIRTAKTAINVPSLQSGEQRYYWRLIANNGGFKNQTDIRTFTTGAIAPQLLEPADAVTLATTEVNFKWASVSAAQSYKLQIATSPLFSLTSIRFEQSHIDSTSFHFDNLDPNKKCFWRIASEIDGNAGDYSAPRSFTTGVSTGIPVALKQSARIFPNPVKDLLSILFNEQAKEQTEMVIFDQQGRTVKLVLIEKGTLSHTVSLKALTPGVYFYSLISAEQVERGKLIVE